VAYKLYIGAVELAHNLIIPSDMSRDCSVQIIAGTVMRHRNAWGITDDAAAVEQAEEILCRIPFGSITQIHTVLPTLYEEHNGLIDSVVDVSFKVLASTTVAHKSPFVVKMTKKTTSECTPGGQPQSSPGLQPDPKSPAMNH
jgi:hypothetical protein